MKASIYKPVVFVQADLISLLDRPGPLCLYAKEIKDEMVFHFCANETEGKIPVVRSGQEPKAFPYLSFQKEKTDSLTFFFHQGEAKIECETLLEPMEEDFFSRSKGLLETSLLKEKKVAIIGLGSFGSNVAVELAKCGLVHFNLYDFDRLEPGNIVRHICGFRDVGRLKTFAVRDEILQKNPLAKVNCFNFNINEEKEEFKKSILDADLIFCLTDENRSRLFITECAIQQDCTVLFGRAVTRAEGGDVLRFRPNKGPCIACLSGRGIFKPKEEEISTLKQSQRNAPGYMTDQDVENQVQVGLTTDIIPICNFLVKLALFELTKGNASGIESMEADLQADYYFWVNRRELKYKAFKPLGFQISDPTILRWYGVRLERNPNCITCGI